MYLADLTRHDDLLLTRTDVLNVGWLCHEHAFPIGPTPPRFVLALRELVSSPVRSTMGFHICDLCPPPVEIIGSDGVVTGFTAAPGSLGNGEIRVPGLGGVVYAAPVLIAHYVEVHHYLPPAEFVDAVMAMR